jgi:hypothetical protein
VQYREGRSRSAHSPPAALANRPDKHGRPAFGEKLKRAVFRSRAGELPLDLLAATRPVAQWGVIFAVRTGPGAFSTRLVTARRYGGGTPEGFRVRDGALRDGDRLVETPEEADPFAALGLPWLPPERRPDPVRPVRRAGGWARRAGGWARHDPAAGADGERPVEGELPIPRAGDLLAGQGHLLRAVGRGGDALAPGNVGVGDEDHPKAPTPEGADTRRRRHPKQPGSGDHWGTAWRRQPLR